MSESFAQRVFQHPRFLGVYERHVYGPFLSLFAGRRVTYERVYRTLRTMAPAGHGPQEHAGREHTPQGADRPAYVVDLGCGTGWFTRRIMTDPRCRDARIVGLDMSEQAVDVARRRSLLLARTQGQNPPTFLTGDARNASTLVAEGADEIWICGALHQMGDPQQVLREASTILGRGGLLFCQTFGHRGSTRTFSARIMGRFGHEIFSTPQIHAMAAGAGLTVEAVRTWGLVMLLVLRRPAG